MLPSNFKKRRIDDAIHGKTRRPKKRIRKQLDYHSSSDESSEHENGGADFQPVDLEEASRSDNPKNPAVDSASSSSSSTDAESASEDSSPSSSAISSDDNDNNDNATPSTPNPPPSKQKQKQKQKHLPKRHDPSAFSTSITKILSTRLPPSTRHDPVLSRSRSTTAYTSQLADERLERRAQEKLKSEKKENLERGRVKDVLGLEGRAGETAEKEKQLRKVAQRGVVKLFNAVRAAQVKAEEVGREERRMGRVGMEQRKERVDEVSKREFLDLIGGGGGGKESGKKDV